MPPKTKSKETKSEGEPSKKGRGRPPITKSTKKQVYEEPKEDEEELVLHLPSFDEDATDNKNVFTMIDTEVSETKKTVNRSDSSKEDSSSSGQDINKLIDEIKRQDTIIKTLNANLKNAKSHTNDNTLTITKENKKTMINLGLISYDGSKLRIAETTNLACWWCTYNFDTMPLFLPEKYHNNKYYVFGNFCSFGCMLAYNDNLDDYRRLIRTSLIKKVYQDIFHSECNIKPACVREVLEKFGGPMTIDKFRDSKTLITKTIKLTIPPMIPLIPYYEETILDKN